MDNYTKLISYSLVIMKGPILTYDVWEHVYYLDYQNRHTAHLDSLWQIVDWTMIEKRYSK